MISRSSVSGWLFWIVLAGSGGPDASAQAEKGLVPPPWSRGGEAPWLTPGPERVYEEGRPRERAEGDAVRAAPAEARGFEDPGAGSRHRTMATDFRVSPPRLREGLVTHGGQAPLGVPGGARGEIRNLQRLIDELESEGRLEPRPPRRSDPSRTSADHSGRVGYRGGQSATCACPGCVGLHASRSRSASGLRARAPGGRYPVPRVREIGQLGWRTPPWRSPGGVLHPPPGGGSSPEEGGGPGRSCRAW